MADNSAKRRIPLVQFSLGTLLLLMTWLAVVCIALSRPSAWWSGFVAFVNILAILSAALVAIYAPGSARAFAVGFVLFGGGYYYCLHRLGEYSPHISIVKEPTRSALDWVHEAHVRQFRRGPARSPLDEFVDTYNYSVEVVQSASIMLFAVLGGLLARSSWGRSQCLVRPASASESNSPREHLASGHQPD